MIIANPVQTPNTIKAIEIYNVRLSFSSFSPSTTMKLLFISLSFVYEKIEDFSVDLDDESWHIVTKDNIKGNEDIKELGITEEYMENFMKTYSAYMDSMLMYDEENFVEIAVIEKNQMLNITCINIVIKM